MRFGFISIRNEDGTQWLSSHHMWSPFAYRRAFTFELFEQLEREAPESKKNDCPDNGFFGMWNLTFHDCSEETALAQNMTVDALDAEEEADFRNAFDDDWDGTEEYNYLDSVRPTQH